MQVFDPALAPFTVAILVMTMIAALELGGLLFGASISSAVDSVVPDLDVPDIDGGGPEMPDAVGPFSAALSWLSVGRAPLLILLAAFLTGFGVAGLAVQNGTHAITSSFLPSWIAAVPAIFAALPVTRYAGRFWGQVMRPEETDAVSRSTLVGRVAVVFRGEARAGFPAEAKLKDHRGSTHYVLVEPDEAEAVFSQGSEVLLVEQSGAVFRAILNPSAALSPE